MFFVNTEILALININNINTGQRLGSTQADTPNVTDPEPEPVVPTGEDSNDIEPLPVSDDAVEVEEAPDLVLTYEDALTNLKNIMSDPTNLWENKRYSLIHFVDNYEPKTVSCVKMIYSPDETSLSAWNVLNKLRNNASGDIRLYFDDMVDYFDGVDAEAMFAEIDSFEHSGFIVTFAKYGLDYGAYLDFQAETEVRHKFVTNTSYACTYDIEYTVVAPSS